MAAQRRAKRSARDSGTRATHAYEGAVHSQMVELQRARIIAATFEVTAKRGAGNVTVAHVVERSGVSRRTFYEQFTDREDCLLAAFEQALSLAAQRVVPAFEAQKGWSEQIRAGLITLLAFLEEEPAIGRLLVVESLAAGAGTLVRRAQVVGVLTGIVDRGRSEAKGAGVSALTAEGVVGGVLSVIQARLVQADGPPLIELANPLMNMIVLPYLGVAAGRRELNRVVMPVEPASVNGVWPADPFKETGMRLTYRTVRVLTAIAQHPDGSNRTIGETAGITDQGQISKLLARLERIGLAENTHRHTGKGAPNSWMLTAKGKQVVQTIDAHMDSAHTEDFK